MSAIWVQPELVPPALREALARFGDDHPWECAVTMQCLANTSGGLAEALGLGARERGVVPPGRRSHVRGQHAVHHGATVDVRRHRR